MPTSTWEPSPSPLPIALGDLLNSVLGPRHIQATITHQAWGISITLLASQKINQAPAITLIEKALDKLQVTEPITVHLQARCLGIPDWQTHFEFAGDHPSQELTKREIQPFKPTAPKRPLAAKTFVNRQPSPGLRERLPIPLALKTVEPLPTPQESKPICQPERAEQSIESTTTPGSDTPNSPPPPERSDPTPTLLEPISTPNLNDSLDEHPISNPLLIANPTSKELTSQESSAEPTTLQEPEPTADALLHQIEAKLDEILTHQFADLIPAPEDSPELPARPELWPQSPQADSPPALEVSEPPEILTVEPLTVEPEPPSQIIHHPPPEPPPLLDSLTSDLWDDEPPPQSPEFEPSPGPVTGSPTSEVPPPQTDQAPQSQSATPPDLNPAASPRYTIPKVERVPRDQEAKVVGLTGLVMGVGFCATGLGTVIGLPMVIGGAYMLGDQEILRGACPHCGQPLKVGLGKMWRFSCPTCQGLVQIKNGRFYQVISSHPESAQPEVEESKHDSARPGYLQ